VPALLLASAARIPCACIASCCCRSLRSVPLLSCLHPPLNAPSFPKSLPCISSSPAPPTPPCPLHYNCFVSCTRVFARSPHTHFAPPALTTNPSNPSTSQSALAFSATARASSASNPPTPLFEVFSARLSCCHSPVVACIGGLKAPACLRLELKSTFVLQRALSAYTVSPCLPGGPPPACLCPSIPLAGPVQQPADCTYPRPSVCSSSAPQLKSTVYAQFPTT